MRACTNTCYSSSCIRNSSAPNLLNSTLCNRRQMHISAPITTERMGWNGEFVTAWHHLFTHSHRQRFSGVAADIILQFVHKIRVKMVAEDRMGTCTWRHYGSDEG